MTDEEIREFWEYVREARSKFPEWRLGQTYMNALRELYPELYFDVSQTKYDVFYRDTSQDIYRFREYLGLL